MLDGTDWISYDHVIFRENLYFVSFGNLIRVDCETWKMHCVTNISNAAWLRDHTVAHMVASDLFIFLISFRPMCIARYDIEENKIVQIFENDAIKNIQNNMAKWNGKIYIFPRQTDVVIEITDMGQIELYPFPLSEDRTYMYNCQIDDEVWFIPQNGSRYYRYNISGRNISISKLPFELEMCMDVCVKQNSVFFLQREYIINWQNQKYVKYINIKSNDKDEIEGLLIPLENAFYILPKRANDIYLISSDGKTEKYKDYPKDYHYTQSEDWLKVGSKYFAFEKRNGIYYFPRRATNYMLSIDSCCQKIVWIAIEELEIDDEVRACLQKNSGIITEKAGYLSNFIRIL